MSDCATCYQKNRFPVLAPAVGRVFNISVQGDLHTETQQGNGLAAAHFAVAMRHVNMYFVEKVVAVDIFSENVVPLSSRGGGANSTDEWINSSREKEGVVQSLAAVDYKRIGKLGRVKEVRYDHYTADSIRSEAFEYPGGASTS